MQDFEFTIQEGKLYMLQTRNGKRTGPAAVRIAVAHGRRGHDFEEGSRSARRSRLNSISCCIRSSIPKP